VSHTRNLRITIALSVAALAAALAPSAQAANVCNQAGNGHVGGIYVSQGTPDLGPAARHKSELKALGNGKGNGLAQAAERSPALSECGLPSSDDNGGVN
jgi:hypothetical protein